MSGPKTKLNNDGLSLNTVPLDGGYAVSCYVGVCAVPGARGARLCFDRHLDVAAAHRRDLRLTQRSTLRPEIV